MTTTFKQIESEASALRSSGGAFGCDIDNIVDSGRANADETIFVEKAQPESEWERIALASIGDQLSTGQYGVDIIDWFAERGLRF